MSFEVSRPNVPYQGAVGVKDEGTQLTPAASSMNFVGAGVTATNSGTAVTVTIPGGGSGTVTSVSVVSANGFAGTVANASSTPAITLSTSVTGLVKGNGTALSAATDGTDYLSGTTYKPRIGNAVVTGVLTGCVISINADPTKFDITAGTVLIVDNYTNPAAPTFSVVSYAGGTAITPTSSNAVINLAINSSGTLVQTVGSVSSSNRRDLALIGGIATSAGTVIDISNGKVLAFDTAGTAYDLMFALGNINISGNNYSANGANLKVDRSAGVTFFFGGTGNNKDPNNLVTTQGLGITFQPIYRNATGGTTFETATTDIDTTHYDNGTGTLATVNNNKYSLRWFIFLPTVPRTFVAYGQAEYSSLDAAIAGMQTESPVINTTDFSTEGMQIRGCLAIKKGETVLNNPATAVFRNGGQFGLVNGSSSTATSLQNLQGVYNASITPEITTDAARGAFTVQRGSAADTDAVYEGNNGAGSTTFSVTGAGVITGTGLALGSGNLTMTGSLGATGARLTAGWFTDLTVTNAIAGSVTGNAGTVTNGIYTTSDATALAATSVGNKDKYLHSNASTGVLEWATVAGFSWGSAASGTSGTGLALTVDNSASASTVGQSITVGNTQTQIATGLSIDTGTSSIAHTGLEIKALYGTLGSSAGLKINSYAGATQPLGNATGILMGYNFNTNSANYGFHQLIRVESNAGGGYNTGIRVDNYGTAAATIGSAIGRVGFGVSQIGADGTAILVFGGDNVNSATNGLVNYTLSSTQSAASVVQKIDLSSSARTHTGLQILNVNAAASLGVDVQFSTTGVGIAYKSTSSKLAGGEQFANWSHASSGTLTACTVDKSTISSSRTHTAASSVTDNYNVLTLTRTSVNTNAGGTLLAQGAILNITNTTTPTAGTLTDTVDLLKLTQDTDATGNLINGGANFKVLSTGVTNTTAVNIIGTAGAGFLTLVAQASNPTSPAAGTLLLHSSTTNGFTRLEQDNESATNLVLGRDNAQICYNNSGGALAKGTIVYISGTNAGSPEISAARANSATTLPAIGVVMDNIANGGYGQVMTKGIMTGLNTNAFSANDSLYVSTSSAGGMQNTRPSGTSAAFVQRIGKVLVQSATVGIIDFNFSLPVLNMETGTTAATWTGNAIVVTTVNTLTVGLGNNSISGNTAVGVGALAGNNSGGGNNTAIGNSALIANTSGNSNTAIGYGALSGNTTGLNNTALGNYALLSNVGGSRNVSLGYSAGRYETGSDAFYVDNQDRTNTAGDKAKALLYGTFNATASSQTLAVNGVLSSPYTSTINTSGSSGSCTGNAATASAVAVGGITGLGTGVATALAVNVGSAGAFVTNGGALGTPSGGTLTNCGSLPISGLTASTSTAIGVGSIELGHASDTTIARVSAGVISVEGVTVDTISAANTLTNKRITPRVLSAASYTTDTGTSLNCDTLDQFIVTAQAGALKFNNPTGTPTDGQKLIIAVTGTAARALTWDTQFEASTVALPTTTVTTARLNMGFIWRADTSKWVIVAAA